MAIFYLIRHGKTDYSEQNQKIYQGFGVHLSPLDSEGVQEIQQTAKDKRLRGAGIILSSPYTRAVQTAAILSKDLQIAIAIETDLHEWLANKNYVYEDDEIAEAHYREFVQCHGVYPVDQVCQWEDVHTIRKRVLPVLARYRHHPKVIVACHGMLIQSLCNGYHPKNGEIVPFEY